MVPKLRKFDPPKFKLTRATSKWRDMLKNFSPNFFKTPFYGTSGIFNFKICWKMKHPNVPAFDSSDDPAVGASASGAVDASLIPSRVKPMALKLVFTASLLILTLIKGIVWRTSRQVYLLRRWERHLSWFSYLGVVGRRPTTPKRARYRALIAFVMGG